MTLAVMTRASLGHTGQRLIASLPTQAIYAAALVAVLARICAVIETAHSDALLHLAAAAWSAAFSRLLRHVWASAARSRQAVAQAGARLTSICVKLWREADSVAARGS
mgnify:CR=1 FL=1